MLKLKYHHLAASTKIMDRGNDHQGLLTLPKEEELVIKCLLNGLHTPPTDSHQASNSQFVENTE